MAPRDADDAVTAAGHAIMQWQRDSQSFYATRLRRRISLLTLAQATALPLARISAIERGVQRPTPDEWFALLAALLTEDERWPNGR